MLFAGEHLHDVGADLFLVEVGKLLLSPGIAFVGYLAAAPGIVEELALVDGQGVAPDGQLLESEVGARRPTPFRALGQPLQRGDRRGVFHRGKPQERLAELSGVVFRQQRDQQRHRLFLLAGRLRQFRAVQRGREPLDIVDPRRHKLASTRIACKASKRKRRPRVEQMLPVSGNTHEHIGNHLAWLCPVENIEAPFRHALLGAVEPLDQQRNDRLLPLHQPQQRLLVAWYRVVPNAQRGDLLAHQVRRRAGGRRIGGLHGQVVRPLDDDPLGQ